MRNITPRLGRRHDLVVGAGYRLVDEHVGGGFTFSITPESRH